MKSKIVIGLILIIGGILIALSSLNIMPLENYIIKIAIASLVVIYGLYQLFFRRNIFWGGLVISLASMYILNFFIEDAWKFFVPLILIFLGLEFIFSKTGIIKRKNHDNMTREDSPGDTIQVSSVLSGNGKRVVSNSVKGGSVSAFLGGSEIDLTNAIIAPEGATIDVSCIMGGIEFKLPSKMKLQNEVTAILGGTDIEGSPSPIAEGTTLIVRGTCAFGGVNFKYVS